MYEGGSWRIPQVYKALRVYPIVSRTNIHATFAFPAPCKDRRQRPRTAAGRTRSEQLPRDIVCSCGRRRTGREANLLASGFYSVHQWLRIKKNLSLGCTRDGMLCGILGLFAEPLESFLELMWVCSGIAYTHRAKLSSTLRHNLNLALPLAVAGYWTSFVCPLQG